MSTPLRTVLATIALVSLGSCDLVKRKVDNQSTSQPQDATGETPIRYVLCSELIGGGCKVIARFDDLKSCDFYKKFSQSVCSDSTPGTVICRTDQSTMSKGWCLP